MSRSVTFHGAPLTLVGRSLNVGDLAPDFRVVSNELKEVRLADFKDTIKVVTFFPSLDTPVCDLQVKEFNKKAVAFSSLVVVIGISKDLPFAQKRFCSLNEIKNITVVSDYKTSSFGINFGFLIKELNLLARGVLIIDRNNVVRYIQLVKELTAAPEYEDALKNLELILKNPEYKVDEVVPSHCKPCEGGVAALPKDSVEKLLAGFRGWEVQEGKALLKKFKFKDFQDAKYFLDLVSLLAEEQGHHPRLSLNFNMLSVSLTTHAAGGLTENDFIMAKIIDSLLSGS